MKNSVKVLAAVVALLISVGSVNAQNVVGKVKRGPILIAELSYADGADSTQFKLRYLDSFSGILKSIQFSSKDIQLESLHASLSGLLSKENGASEDFEISDTAINATTQKMVGLKNVVITINESSNFGLNGNEIYKLFGK
jgi:hypothetical protein